MIGYNFRNMNPMKYLTCPMSGRKILPDHLCDGVVDCQIDQWDEQFCDDCNLIPQRNFECQYQSKCISSSQLCDGINDCFGGFDEMASLGCVPFLQFGGNSISSSLFYIEDEQLIADVIENTIRNSKPEVQARNRKFEKNKKVIFQIKNVNREMFGKRLKHKIIESVPDRNIVRIPILNFER